MKLLPSIVLGGVLLSGAASADGIDFTTFANNPQRNNYNADESTLNPGNAGSVTQHWAADLGAPVLTQPTLARQVATAAGPQDLVFAATLAGVVFALNAQTGAVVWQQPLQVVQTDCADFAANGGQVGVLGTPTIDLANNRLFVVDGMGSLHALDLGSGADQQGYPVPLLNRANRAPRTLVYGSPTLAGGLLFVTTASACDEPPYHGQVIRFDPGQLAVTGRWFTDGRRGPDGGGIWGPGGVSANAAGDTLYVATGNALTDPENSGYADQVVALGATDFGVLAADSPALDGTDVDFGATPLVFTPAGCPTMLAVMNKSGTLLTYDSGNVGAGAMQRLQIAPGSSTGSFIGVPTYSPDTNTLYLGNPGDSDDFGHGLVALSVGADCQLTPRWTAPVGLNDEADDNPMMTPAVANGVVWYVDGLGGNLYAFDADTGAQLFTQSIAPKAGLLAAPAVINGQVFVAGNDHHLYAFGP